MNNPGATWLRGLIVSAGGTGQCARGCDQDAGDADLGVDSNGVANLLAAFSGRDEETIDEAKKRAPRSLKSRCRAVTAEDFEYLATQAANVRRAKALPLFHPDFPGTRIPGRVSHRGSRRR